MRHPPVAVLDQKQAQAVDAQAIAAGIPSRALMQRAGAAAAGEIARRFGGRIESGVLIVTGSGNNGGDGWVVAHALASAGVGVRVVECAAAKTSDCVAERASALTMGVRVESGIVALRTGAERIVVDALLGTGFQAGHKADGTISESLKALNEMKVQGRAMIALDLPSGLDANSGEHSNAVCSDLTVSFGSMKRGLLIARELCGEIILVDIGLGAHLEPAVGCELVTPQWFHTHLPPIHAASHKGTRKRIAIVGGDRGMAGAVILAARAALRSGAGLVHCVVHDDSVRAVQEAEPAAIVSGWSDLRRDFSSVLSAADAILVGPGLGTGNSSLAFDILRSTTSPVVLDADGLNAFAGHAADLTGSGAPRQILLTPHPLEFARLTGSNVEAVLARRFDVPWELAELTRCTVLLKGVPTTIATAAKRTLVVAEGNPILATGGAGDVLGGIAVALLAQTGDAHVAAGLAAFAHGRAAHRVSGDQVRGFILADVIAQLPEVWSTPVPLPIPPLLAELPSVGERS